MTSDTMSSEEPNNIFDISQLDLEGDFENQVSQILSAVRLSRQEVEELQQLIIDLTGALSICWPGCVVHPFGSIITGLGIRGSDVDCFVAIPRVSPSNSKKIIYKARACLELSPYSFSDVSVIPMAMVPLVKCFHIPTSTHCDVNFKSPSGVQNSKLLAYLLHIHPHAVPLAVLIKYYSKVHKFTGTNFMPSYALTLLVVFFLQVKGLLPAVHVLQETSNELMVEHWNAAFREIDFIPKSNSLTLFQLLGEFFVYYSNFDFSKQIICPYLGRPLPIGCFNGTAPTPPEFHLYKDNLDNRLCRPLKVHIMTVQDPFEHCRNCAGAVYPRLGAKIMKLFQNSAVYYKQLESDFLKNILTPVAEEVIEQPRHVLRGVHKPFKEKFNRQKRLKNHVMLMYNQLKKNKKHKA